MSADLLAPLTALEGNVREKTAEAQMALGQVAANLTGTTLSLEEVELLECRARDILAEKRHPRYATAVRRAFQPIKLEAHKRDRKERMAAWVVERETKEVDPDTIDLTLDDSLTARTEKACTILARKGQERIYRQGGALSRLRMDGEQTLIEVLSSDALRGEMDRDIKFMGIKDDVLTRIDPPVPLVKNLYAWPDYSEFRQLRGLTSTPFISPSGKPITTVGYNSETGVFLVNTLDFGTLPDAPTEADVQEAVALLKEPFVDFPFAHEAGLTHVLALVLTPIARELIAGVTPIFAVDASRPRTGKGLLVKLVGEILTGKTAAGASLPSTDEEIRKNILAKLRGGPTMVWIDNVNRAVDSGSLAAVLTMEEWRDRILGESKEMVVPNRCAWVMTGNNMTFSQEMTGRVAWIRLVAQTDRPSTRTDFKRDEEQVQEWVRANRPALFRAAMMLVQNWLAKGRPAYSGPRLGGFAQWCSVVGGVLQAAGVTDFLGNMEELVSVADNETDEWDQFIEAWWDKHGEKPVTTKALLDVDGAVGVLALVGDKGDVDPARLLGGVLKAHRDTLWLLEGEAGEPERRVWVRRFEDTRGAGKRSMAVRRGWRLQLRQPGGAPISPQDGAPITELGGEENGLIRPDSSGAPIVPLSHSVQNMGVKEEEEGEKRGETFFGGPKLIGAHRGTNYSEEPASECFEPKDTPVDVAAAQATHEKATVERVAAQLRHRLARRAPR